MGPEIEKLRAVENRYNITLLTTRIIPGAVALGHGLQKFFGWFGDGSNSDNCRLGGNR